MLANSSSYAAADTQAKNWGIGGSNSRALNAATTLITGALGGQTDLQAAANALAPYAAAGIGQQFGHGDNQNEAAQAVSHFVLGATLAYINGGDPLSGGSAAVAAETAAQYLSRQYNDGQTARDPITGEFNPNLLPESVKEEIRTTTGAIAALVGATGDGSAAFNAQVAAVIGQNAVENNDSGDISGHFAGDRAQLRKAQRLYPNNPANVNEYLTGQRTGEAIGAAQGVQDIIDGVKSLPASTWNGIKDNAQLLTDSYGIIPLYQYNRTEQAYREGSAAAKAIMMDLKDWNAAYDYALKNDPYLAGQMQGMMNARVSVHVSSMVIPVSALVKGGQTTKLGSLLSTKTTQGFNRIIGNDKVNLPGKSYQIPFPTLNPTKVTVYRVEGSPNTRILINEHGNVSITGDTTLYLNFGSRERAIEFLKQRDGQNFPDATVKTFTVPKSVLKDLQKAAIHEKDIKRLDPNKIKPVIADPTKALNQFGVRPNSLKDFEDKIHKGSGKNAN